MINNWYIDITTSCISLSFYKLPEESLTVHSKHSNFLINIIFQKMEIFHCELINFVNSTVQIISKHKIIFILSDAFAVG